MIHLPLSSAIFPRPENASCVALNHVSSTKLPARWLQKSLSVGMRHLLRGCDTTGIDTSGIWYWCIKIFARSIDVLSPPIPVLNPPAEAVVRLWVVESSRRFAGSQSQGVGRWAPAATRFTAYAPSFFLFSFSPIPTFFLPIPNLVRHFPHYQRKRKRNCKTTPPDHTNRFQ